MFDNTKNTTEQGNIGEARAIYEYIKMGFVVSKPINDKARYDLIVDDGENIRRVQVKTTSKKEKQSKSGYGVKICSTYANRNASHTKLRSEGDYDLLFVMTVTGDVWSIPTEALGDAKGMIVVGNKKYNEYKL